VTVSIRVNAVGKLNHITITIFVVSETERYSELLTELHGYYPIKNFIAHEVFVIDDIRSNYIQFTATSSRGSVIIIAMFTCVTLPMVSPDVPL